MSVGRSVVWLSLRCSSGSLIEEDLGKCYCCCSYCCLFFEFVFFFTPHFFIFHVCYPRTHAFYHSPIYFSFM